MIRIKRFFVWASMALAFSAGATSAEVLAWQSFDGAPFVGLFAGPDLLVGTGDDVAVATFNTNGDLAHIVVFRPNITFVNAFTFDATYNDAPALEADGTSLDFTLGGQSIDDNPAFPLIPFFYRDDPTISPHQFVYAAGGRTYSFAYNFESCPETDPNCINPNALIPFTGNGLIQYPGENPATVFAGAPDVASFFSDNAVGANVPAYLSFLATNAPPNWAAISLSVVAIPIQEGINCTGTSCVAFDGETLLGVTPAYTLPEATGGLVWLAALGALSTLGRRRRRSCVVADRTSRT